MRAGGALGMLACDVAPAKTRAKGKQAAKPACLAGFEAKLAAGAWWASAGRYGFRSLQQLQSSLGGACWASLLNPPHLLRITILKLVQHCFYSFFKELNLNF